MSTRRVTRSTASQSKIGLADPEATPRPQKVAADRRKTATRKASVLPFSEAGKTLQSTPVVYQTELVQPEEIDDDNEDRPSQDAPDSSPVTAEQSTAYGKRSLSRQSSPPSTRHAFVSNSTRLDPFLPSPPSTSTITASHPVASKDEITTLLFASKQLLSLYIDSKNQGLPVNPQKETIFWQLLQATRALFPSPSTSTFLLSAPSVDPSGQSVPSTSDPVELAAFRLSDYAVFLHAIAGIRGTAASEAQLDELQDAWRMFLQLFKESNEDVGMSSVFRNDGLLTLLLDIGTQLYILKRSTLSILEQSQLLDELFSSSLVSRRTSQQGLRTKALKSLDDERWLAMSRARLAELKTLQSNPEARFSFAAFQREVINFVQSRQSLLLDPSQNSTPSRRDLESPQALLQTARSDLQNRPRLSEPIHHPRAYSRNPSIPTSVRTSYSASIGSRYSSVFTPNPRRVSSPLPRRQPLYTPMSRTRHRGSLIYSSEDEAEDPPPVRSEPRSKTKPRYSALSIPPTSTSPLRVDTLSPPRKSNSPNFPESPLNKGWEGNDTLDTEELEDLLGKDEGEESMDVDHALIVEEDSILVKGFNGDESDVTRHRDVDLASPRSSVEDEELLIMEDRAQLRLSSTSVKIEDDELIDELDLEAIRRSREGSSGSFLRESQIDEAVPSDPLSRILASDQPYTNVDKVLEATFALTRQDTLRSRSQSQSESQANSQPQPPTQNSPTSSIPAKFMAKLKTRTTQLKTNKVSKDHARSSSASTVDTVAPRVNSAEVDSTSLTARRSLPYGLDKILASPVDDSNDGEEKRSDADESAVERTSAFLQAPKGVTRVAYRPPTMTPEPFGSEVQPLLEEEGVANRTGSPQTSSPPNTALEQHQLAPSSSLTLPAFSQSKSLKRTSNKRKAFDTDSEDSDSSIDDSFLRARSERKPTSVKILPPSWPSRVTSSVPPPATSPPPSSSARPMSSVPRGDSQVVSSPSSPRLQQTGSRLNKRQRQISPPAVTSSLASVRSQYPSSSLPPTQPALSNDQRSISSTNARSHTPAFTSSSSRNEYRKNGWSPVETLFFIRVAQGISTDTSNCWTAILKYHGAQGRYSRVLSKRSNVNLKDKMRLILQTDYPSPVKVPNGMVRYLPSGDARKIAWLKGARNQAKIRRAEPEVEREVDRLLKQARRRRIELEGDDDDEDEEPAEPDLESEDGDETETEERAEEEAEEEEEVLDVLTAERANGTPLFFESSDD